MIYFVWALPVVGVLLFVFIKRVPHGWVQWRTGLALKVLPKIDHLSPLELRARLDKLSEKGLPRIKRNLPVASIRDFEVPTRHGVINARLYDDNGDADGAPIIYMHGGGFCFGTLDMFEEVCRRLARVCNRKVISLAYSLSPEYKFPRAHQECQDATVWLSTHHKDFGLNTDKVVLMGDSAGGNLVISTVFALRADGKNHLVANLVPIYPSLEGLVNEPNSLRVYGTDYFLTAESMTSFTDALVEKEEDLYDPRLYLASVNDFEDFPPTFVLNAEFDPLTDDGDIFVKKLKAVGNDAVRKLYKGTIHTFFGVGLLGSQGVTAIEDISAYLKKYKGK